MTKRHWRDTIKALGGYNDPDQDERAKKTKIGIHYFSKKPQSLQFYWRLWDCHVTNKYTRYQALLQVPLQCRPQNGLFWCALPERSSPVLIIPERELDDRVAKLKELIQHKSQGKNIEGPILDLELIELIDNFHKKYQTLYSLYEHVKRHVIENFDRVNLSPSSSLLSLVSFHSSSELTPYNSVQQFEELKRDCTRLSECLVDREAQLSTQKREVKDLTMEAKELEEQNNGLRSLIQELEMTLKQREEKLSDLLIKLEEKEANLTPKSHDLMEKANELQLEIDDTWSEKEIVYQEDETVHMLTPNKRKSESSGFLFQLDLLEVKFEKKNMDLQKIVEEKKGIERKVKNLEIHMKNIVFEGARLGIENEGLHVRISELEQSLMKRNHDVFVLEAEFEGLKNDSSAKIKALGEEIMSLREELNRREHYQKIARGKEEAISKLIEKKTKIKTKYYKSKMKKVQETTEEKQKKSEEVANETMSGQNSVEMKFRDCNDRFLNKSSMQCDRVVVAKKWVKKKNEEINKLEGNLDFLRAEVGRKEAEIMGLKERIWKLENDVRGLGEEKREAIRQLCVWVDYHRNQNNYLKKSLSDLLAFRSLRSS